MNARVLYELGGACLGLALILDNWRLRTRVTKLNTVMAEAAAAVLGNSVLVDGVELPKPDDARWERDKRTHFTDGAATKLLSLGSVTVDDVWRIWIGQGDNSMPYTEQTKTYCAAVWKAYRSRVARKSIDSTS